MHAFLLRINIKVRFFFAEMPDEVPDLLPPDEQPAPVQPLPQGTQEIKLYLGNSVYLVNGESRVMDASPMP